ncbi:MAG TPA: hypothetical protein VK604_24395 [Bryobacteraceae bacterium]|nr:hypothetical protein [Bryobacteraceae bacterium]
MSSEAQLTANRANAALSTGPTTEAGKAKSSHNAVKTGLTGRTILLPTDDREIYIQHIARFFTKYQPVTDDEKALTQSVAESEWRLLRIPTLESGIYAIGRRNLAGEFPDEPDPAVRAAMIDAQVFQNCRKDLSNLALQEARLRRMRDADLATLKDMIKTRLDKQKSDLASASLKRLAALDAGNAFDPTLFGFEFTNDELIDHHETGEARRFMTGEYSELSEPEYKRFMKRRSTKNISVLSGTEQKAA